LISKTDKILILGSCFAANIGARLEGQGYDVLVNPFGTLFNPVSIHNSLLRLRSWAPFTPQECVQMGAGSELWCSFSHYTRFARETPEEFLQVANGALRQASSFFRSCNKVIITFGTAFCFRHIARDVVVSNCLKRPAREFERFRLSVEEIVSLWEDLGEVLGPDSADDRAAGCKEVIFTVSPIRHLADTMHGNQLSKSTLLMAVDEIIKNLNEAGSLHCSYFPSYEIMLDELRDYCWYAEDKVHPSEEAIKLIGDRFSELFLKY